MPIRFSLFATLMFIASGFAALIYQAIWTRYLGHIFGHSALAQTVMLTLFMGGMGAGSWFVSRHDHKIKDPLKLYAYIELAIGAAAVVFHPLYVSSSPVLYGQLASAPSFALLMKSVYALLIVGPQCFLLGVTFPLLSKAVAERSQAGAGKLLSLLYFANSFGAAFGALGSIFFLVPRVGLPGALLFGGFVSILVAVIALASGRRFPAGPSQFDDASVPAAEHRISIHALCWIAALSGACSFVYEIGWIRLLILAQGSSTYSFEIMLSAFILGLSLGALCCRYLVGRVQDVLSFAGAVQLAKGMAVTVGLAIYLQSFAWVAGVRTSLIASDTTFYAFLLGGSLFSILIMFMPAFFAGFTLPLFTWLALRIKNQSALIGRIYAFNTLGSIIGVMSATHLLIVMLGVKGMLIAAAIVDMGLGGYLLWRAQAKGHVFKLLYASSAALLVIAVTTKYRPEVLASGSFRYDRTETSEILRHVDGKTATVSVQRNGATHRVILTNGKPDAGFQTDLNIGSSADENTMTMLALVPVMKLPEIKHAAVIGWGSGMSSTLLAAAPSVQKVSTIEIEPEMYRAASLYREFLEPGYSSPKMNLVFDDAKAFFSSSNERYDLILSEPSNPWVSGVANLFSEQFYELASKNLTEQGIFVQWLQLYEFNDQLLSSAARAMLGKFKYFEIYSLAGSMDLMVIASNAPIAIERFPSDAYLIHKLQRVGISNFADVEVLWRGDRRMLEAFAMSVNAPANNDYFPFIELNAPRAMFKNESVTVHQLRESLPVPFFEFLYPERAKIDEGATARNDSLVQRQMYAQQVIKHFRNEASELSPETQSDALFAAQANHCFVKDRENVEKLIASWAAYNTVLRPDLATELWSHIQFCADRPSVRAWVDFFAAVGARDHARVLALGPALPDATDTSKVYVATAMASADFALRNCKAMPEHLKKMFQLLPAPSSVQRVHLQLLGNCEAFPSS